MLSKYPPVTGGSTFWQGVWCVMGWKGASQRLGGNDHGMGCLGTRATTLLVPLLTGFSGLCDIDSDHVAVGGYPNPIAQLTQTLVFTCSSTRVS